MLSQLELERRMMNAGRNRVEAMTGQAESLGKAHRTPYAHTFHRNYTVVLAELLASLLKEGQGIQGKAPALLRSLPVEGVAFLAVRSCMSTVLAGEADNHRRVAYSIGRSIHNEMVLEQIATEKPDLYFTLSRDFQRRLSDDEEHRMAVFKVKAREAGATWVEWDRGSRDVVGLFLLGRLEDIGLIRMSEPFTAGRGRQAYREVSLSPEARGLMESTVEYLAETRPDYGPCVEEPLPWHGMVGGGYHSAEMQRAHRYLVKCSAAARPRVTEDLAADSPVVQSVNFLQQTAWRVNQRVLDVVLALATTEGGVPGAYAASGHEKPRRPDFSGKEGQPTTPEEQAALATWKTAARKFYEAERVGVEQFGRFYAATRQAHLFREAPSLYFVHFLDSRGRDYCLSSGMSPQGSDLQKALLEFSEGKPLGKDGIRWFLHHGANVYGKDKLPLAERVKWAGEHLPLAAQVAADPVGTVHLWRDAEEPLQFLAWCLEVPGMLAAGEAFESRLRVALDGSCNGLQHFAALLRDAKGGASVNLVPGPTQQDVYMEVAKATHCALDLLPASEWKNWWITKGVERSAMKRTTMTLPYGVTKDSAARYVAHDYLSVEAHDKSLGWRLSCARTLIQAGWAGLEQALPAAMAAREWLGRLGRDAAKRSTGVLYWRTPLGFPASQTYHKSEVFRAVTHLHGSTRIRVIAETADPDAGKHSTALAPNFVHSMDATHLHKVVLACKEAGIKSLGLVHDSFSTHAADTERLGQIIREQFVDLYCKGEWLADLKDQLQGKEDPPTQGDLDIQLVLHSPYSFC